jgi:Xaa-Pro aminopeptidase
MGLAHDHERRFRRCREALREAGAAGAVLFPGSNLRYVTGFAAEPDERYLLCFLPAEGDPAFVAPALYGAQLRAETWVPEVRTYADEVDPRGLLRTTATDLGLARGHLLLDPAMHARFVFGLRGALPDATFGLAASLFGGLRARKDGTELDALRRAAALTDDVAEEVRDLAAVGSTERAFAARIESALAAAGGEELAFDVVVASGPNGARPHHAPGEREIEAGDPVVLDFGTRVDGYPSDQTRTVVYGDADPPPGFRDAFEAVRAAQRAGVEAVEPGAEAGAVDRAARSVLEERGYGEAFVHRTGHGVGLDVHEEPYIVADSDRELEEGMVFSVEPGVYLDGEFGIRIEDLVTVTEGGCERLNDSPRGWRAAGSGT